MNQKIKVAVIGVGNCCSSLFQGIHYYSKKDPSTISGISHLDIGGYKPADIEFVAAFDVDIRKVGKPMSEAIFAQPNCCRFFFTGPFEDHGDPVVQMGAVLDGVSEYMLDQPEYCGFRLSDEEPVDVAKILKESEADIVLNYLPVGSIKATGFYASCAIEAGVAFINNIPVLSLNHPKWEMKFIRAGLPYIGSDIKSQFGASILSQMLQELAFERGMSVDFHQQINVGGNTDFSNMMVAGRLAHKKISKENVIRAQNDLRGIHAEENSIFAGPSTFIPYLKDNKVAYFNLRLRGFGDAPIELDCKLSVQDSENSAGVVIDAIRFLKVAREMGIVGCLRGPSAFTQKSPPKQLAFEDAIKECDALASRQFTKNTIKQKNIEDALKFTEEEYALGGMDYLDQIGE